jgi:hypothetical protein
MLYLRRLSPRQRFGMALSLIALFFAIGLQVRVDIVGPRPSLLTMICTALR